MHTPGKSDAPGTSARGRELYGECDERGQREYRPHVEETCHQQKPERDERYRVKKIFPHSRGCRGRTDGKTEQRKKAENDGELMPIPECVSRLRCDDAAERKTRHREVNDLQRKKEKRAERDASEYFDGAVFSFRKDECGECERRKEDGGKSERVLLNAASDERYLCYSGKSDRERIRKRDEHSTQEKEACRYAHVPFNKSRGNPSYRRYQEKEYDENDLGLYQRYPEERYEEDGEQRNKQQHAPLRYFIEHSGAPHGAIVSQIAKARRKAAGGCCFLP